MCTDKLILQSRTYFRAFKSLKTKMKEQDLIFLEQTENMINLIRGLTPDLCCQEKFSILASFIFLTYKIKE